LAARHKHGSSSSSSSSSSNNNNNNSKLPAVAGNDNLYSANPSELQLPHDAVEHGQKQQPQARAFSPGFKLISPSSASSSPVPTTLASPNPSPVNAMPPSSTNAVNQAASSSSEPGVQASLSPFATGITSSYRRSIVVRHMHGKLL
jgi:hypothetical protein